jgi:protein-disulfide isomerase
MLTSMTRYHTNLRPRRSSARRGMTLGGLGLCSCLLLGCTGDKPAKAEAPARTQPAAAENDLPAVLATVGDEQITISDIRSRRGDDLDQMETRYLRARHKLIESTLDDIVRDRMLQVEAKKQGKTVDQLVLAETGGSLEPSDSAITAWYQQNRSRTQGRSLDQIRPQVAEFLRTERRKEASEKLQQRLKQEQKVRINLQPYRVQLNNDGAPSTGPANAAVTLVEFSDFQCPYCGRFFPTLKQVEQGYGDKLRIVYRQYPLTNLHPNAFKAAEASLCANDQGKFWEMHDAMFQDQDHLAVKDLKATAARLGLDQKKFNTCLDTGRHTERVQEDMAEGSKVGVTGTPALFVNGAPMEGGAVPYEVVAQAIDKALAAAKQ